MSCLRSAGTDTLVDERMGECVECVVWFAFRVFVVVVASSRDGFLLFHLDAREMIHQPLD